MTYMAQCMASQFGNIGLAGESEWVGVGVGRGCPGVLVSLSRAVPLNELVP